MTAKRPEPPPQPGDPLYEQKNTGPCSPPPPPQVESVRSVITPMEYHEAGTRLQRKRCPQCDEFRAELHERDQTIAELKDELHDPDYEETMQLLAKSACQLRGFVVAGRLRIAFAFLLGILIGYWLG